MSDYYCECYDTKVSSDSRFNMEASTTIYKMFAGNKIYVPLYQKGYSWETELEDTQIRKQVNLFLTDLEDYNQSSASTPYAFGHFLFVEKSERNFGVVDGQQRLTTIIMFLSALFSKLKSIRTLTEIEEELFENMIKCKSKSIFSTIEYDNHLFKNYIIDQKKKYKIGNPTVSTTLIVKAFDLFTKALSNKDEVYITKMLKTIKEASCRTHTL